ncbi:hypothetical protein ABZ876_37745 [Streptomyces sp. NPDC046931]|uniref:hypothetical protein n=1 Tax=Streptomyces sp. NPDC046931 TaxID=3154806 RepID=UPI0033CF967F
MTTPRPGHPSHHTCHSGASGSRPRITVAHDRQTILDDPDAERSGAHFAGRTAEGLCTIARDFSPWTSGPELMTRADALA